jgi:hypothetical protein
MLRTAKDLRHRVGRSVLTSSLFAREEVRARVSSEGEGGFFGAITIG